MSTLVDTLRDTGAAIMSGGVGAQVLAATAATVVLGATARHVLSSSSSSTTSSAKLPLPPCPPAWPLVGHLPLLASASDPDKLIQKLAREYGPVYHLKLGNVIAIVISSNELAQETLIKRGKTYAGRWLGKAIDLATDGAKDMVYAPYGERWSHLRKVAHRILTPLKLTQMDRILETESLRFVRNLAASGARNEPFEMKRHLMFYTVNIMLAKCLGITYDSPDHPAIQSLCNDILKIFDIGAVGCIEDYFDARILDWIAMRHKAKIIDGVCERVHKGLVWNRLVELKAKLDDERARGINSRADRELCYAEELILTMDEDKLTLSNMKHLILDFLFAGMDSTAATLLWLVVYLVNNPEHQARLHAEVDVIVQAHGRLPSLDDFEDLPFTHAVVKEVTLHSPVTALGVPRKTLADDTLAGYHIPEGAQVIYNIVGINQGMMGDLHEFRPDRWIECDNLTLMDGTATFGSGRRMCPGVHLATREMLILVSRMVACVQLENAKGDRVKIDMTSEFGLTILPKETVLVKATMRGPQGRDLVEKVEAQIERAASDQDVAQTVE